MITIDENNSLPVEEKLTLTENCCGTAYASKFLNLSLGSIQKLVEKKELLAWKTDGGHRRISIQSILNYQNKCNMILQKKTADTDDKLRVLLVENDDIAREALRHICINAIAHIECTAMTSGMEALIDIARIRPHVLISNLDMPGLDGFEFLGKLRENPQFDKMVILALSTLTDDEIQARGGLPYGSIHMPKSVEADWVNGFLAGMMVTSCRTHFDANRKMAL